MRVLSAVLALGLAAPALAQDDQLKVKEGDEVPDIKLAATQNKDKEISIRDLKGKNVVLFFYPRAMTPGCTKESCGFRDVSKQFADVNTVVLGISTDPLDKQQQFTDKEKLNFPLLADNEMKMARALGVMSPKGSATKRVTFVINKEGKIAKIYEKVDPTKHPEEVLTYVKEHLNK